VEISGDSVAPSLLVDVLVGFESFLRALVLEGTFETMSEVLYLVALALLAVVTWPLGCTPGETSLVPGNWEMEPLFTTDFERFWPDLLSFEMLFFSESCFRLALSRSLSNRICCDFGIIAR
jgi:hypothetical protein